MSDSNDDEPEMKWERRRTVRNVIFYPSQVNFAAEIELRLNIQRNIVFVIFKLVSVTCIFITCRMEVHLKSSPDGGWGTAC